MALGGSDVAGGVMTDTLDISNPQPGLYTGVSDATYAAIDAVNQSRLKRYLQHSPYTAKALGEMESSPTPSMELGTAVHLAILQPDEWDRRVIRAESFSGKGAVAARQAWKESLPDDAIVLSTDDYARAVAMADGLRDHPLVNKLAMAEGAAEAVIIWRREGVLCKARLDKWFPQAGIGFDLKTARCVTREEFSLSSWKFGYDVQAAWYTEALKQAGFADARFVFAVVDTSEPHEVVVYRPSLQFMSIGRERMAMAWQHYLLCVQTDHWPMTGDGGVVTIDLPTWAEVRWSKDHPEGVQE